MLETLDSIMPLVYIVVVAVVIAIITYQDYWRKLKDKLNSKPKQLQILEDIHAEIKQINIEISKIKECQKASEFVFIKDLVDRCVEAGSISTNDRTDLIAAIDALQNSGVNGRGTALKNIIENLPPK